MSDQYDGNKFFTLEDGIRKATPLLLVLAVVEISDVVFAVDSIPAVSPQTHHCFAGSTRSIVLSCAVVLPCHDARCPSGAGIWSTLLYPTIPYHTLPYPHPHVHVSHVRERHACRQAPTGRCSALRAQVFGVTRDPFIIWTSNMFAIASLRALYGLVATVLSELRFLEKAIAVVLAWIGAKMIIEVRPAAARARLLFLEPQRVRLGHRNGTSLQRSGVIEGRTRSSDLAALPASRPASLLRISRFALACVGATVVIACLLLHNQGTWWQVGRLWWEHRAVSQSRP